MAKKVIYFQRAIALYNLLSSILEEFTGESDRFIVISAVER